MVLHLVVEYVNGSLEIGLTAVRLDYLLFLALDYLNLLVAEVVVETHSMELNIQGEVAGKNVEKLTRKKISSGLDVDLVVMNYIHNKKTETIYKSKDCGR